MYRLGFIGAGKMGGAILSSILAKAVAPAEAIVCDTSDEVLARFAALGAATTKDVTEVAATAEIIFLATKPQGLDPVMEAIAPFLTEKQLVISIAAGKKLATIRSFIGAKPALVRVMPNLPALVGEGLMACVADNGTPPETIAAAEALLSTCGEVIALPEDAFDAVTALSGSGPAFFAYAMKAMADGGIALGLTPEAAQTLALKTMLGTAVYLTETKQDTGDFIKAVCSPKGTTEAGMKVLEASSVRDDLAATLKAASDRSKEL